MEIQYTEDVGKDELIDKKLGAIHVETITFLIPIIEIPLVLKIALWSTFDVFRPVVLNL